MNRMCLGVSEQFIKLFDHWSADYDESVAGNDVEYRDVFESYSQILQAIASRSHGDVIEFGVGTGNLTKVLIDEGHHVRGIEPSSKMRDIAIQKLPHAHIVEGHFLDFPFMDEKVDTFVSSYAFHHLTDEDKEKAIALYKTLLKKGGKIVFGDTIFKDEQAKKQAYQHAIDKGYERLANDLNTEYYTTIPILDHLLKGYGFHTQFEQKNDFVWIIEAQKGRN